MGGRPMPKPQASCTMTVADGMVVKTQHSSAVAKKAQEGHGSSCSSTTRSTAPSATRPRAASAPAEPGDEHGPHRFPVRQREAHLPPSRCRSPRRCCSTANVALQRCTRFSEQIAGDPFIDLLERGAKQQIGVAQDKPFQSYFSGNTIQICPRVR